LLLPLVFQGAAIHFVAPLRICLFALCRISWQTMDWEVCRQEFRAYQEAATRWRYCQRAGRPVAQPLAAVHERYSDLFRRETINSLQASLEAGAFFTSQEKEGAARLRDALAWEHIQTAGREAENELAAYEAATGLNWKAQRVQAANFSETLARENQAAARLDLTARWAERVRGSDDLRAERRRSQKQAAQGLGHKNLREFGAVLSGVAPERLARGAEGFLQQTERLYRAALSRHAPRLWPDADPARLTYADWLFWRHQTQPQPLFPARELLPTYGDFIRGLGWRASQQNNLRFNETERPGKNAAAECFPLTAPQEIVVMFRPALGVSDYREFFAVVGQAQHYAWTSPDLSRLYPAFVYAPDKAVNEGYAALFRAFFTDAAWLREYRAGLEPEPARALAYDETLLLLAEARRWCALLLWEAETDGVSDLRDETLAQSYADRLTEATAFQHDAAFALSELPAPLELAGRLRGLLLAAALGDYLRVRYGRRWWAARRAGDDLIDWWNTGSRYSAEDLARAVGAGELSFDLLADSYREILQSKP
jgi:hypothetical protein